MQVIRLHWQISVENKSTDNGRKKLFTKFPSGLIIIQCWAFFRTYPRVHACVHVCCVCVCTSVCVYTHVCLKACLYSLFCNWSFCVFTLCFLNCFNYVFPALYSFHQGLHFLFSKNTFAPSLAACLSSLPSAASFTFPLVGSPFKSSGLHHLPLPAFYFFVNFWSAQLLFFKAHSREYFLD